MIVDSPLELALGLGTGAVFGALLQKGQVGKYEVILDQLLLREGRVLRTMGTAVAVGSVGVHALARAGYTRLQVKPLRLGGVIPGAVLFGTGLALLGYCPAPRSRQSARGVATPWSGHSACSPVRSSMSAPTPR